MANSPLDQIWQTPLPGSQVSLPIRGTATSGAQLVAFALPQPQPPGGRAGRGQRGAGAGPE